MLAHSFSSRRWLLVATIALLAAIIIAIAGTVINSTGIAAAEAAAPTAGMISGTVTDPYGGLPPSGTVVKLVSPDGNEHGQAQVDPVDGTFSLGPVLNGNYLLQAWAGSGSGHTPSLPVPVAVTGGPVYAGILALTDPSIFGTVFAPDGITPVDARIHVSKLGHPIQISPAPSGTIQVGGLAPATYVMLAEPAVDAPFWFSPGQRVTETAGVTQTVDFVLQPANVAGHITDPNGTPVPGAVVHVLGLIHHTHRRDITSGSGYFAIGDLPPDLYTLIAEPPWYASGLIASAAVEFHVPPAFTDLGNIALRAAPKIVQGVVQTNAGVPVAKARVVANRLGIPARQETVTGPNGAYDLRLSGGLWSLTVHYTDQSEPAHWLYVEPPHLVHFDHNLQPEHKTVNFEVITADATVTGVVEMPDGSTPPFTVTVGLRNNEGHGRAIQTDPADGSFLLRVPHGNYVLAVHPADSGYFGPPPQQVYAPLSDTLDVGNLTLIARDATISGLVTDENGLGVAGVRVTGWTRGHLSAAAETGPDGAYVLAVSAAEWRVRSHVPATMPFIAPKTTLTVPIDSGQHVGDIDFELITAANLVQGQLVDPNGRPVHATGWATARSGQGVANGAPTSGGSFAIYLPDGPYQTQVQLSPGSGWLAGPPQTVTVAGGEVVTLTVPLQPQNAQIVGALWDPRQEIVVEGVDGHVLAANLWTWVGNAISPSNGTYHLGVNAGLWHLGYSVDPRSGYVPLDHHQVVPLEANQTLFVPLPVAYRDGVIAGSVLDPSGRPLAGAAVVASGIGPLLNEVTLRTLSGDDGTFRLPVPHGVYRLRAHTSNRDWLSPAERSVTVPRNGAVTGIIMQFLEPDATLSGVVTLAGRSPGDGRVHIWAYSPLGAAAHTSALLGETYQLELLQGTSWHIGAVLETNSTFWGVRESVVLTGNQTLDLALRGPHPKPGPIVVKFDAASEQALRLADGTSIFVPAGAMPVAGEVTLHITPIATFPHQHHARLYKYGYAFIATDPTGTAITSQFNQNVIISFTYDEVDLLAWHLKETHLKPAYYSTTTESWTIPENYVVDTAANRVVMQIDHFTDFTLLNESVGYDVYLPVMAR